MKTSFSDRINTHEAALKKMTPLFNFVGYGKLLGILLLGALVYFIFARSFPIGLLVVGVFVLAGNVALWIYHYKLHRKMKFLSGIIAINRRHLDRMHDKWITFSDTGSEFIDREHPYSGDLDIVGKKSFFQFLNTTHTWHGRQAFANDLLQPNYNENEITTRQNAIAELNKDIDFSNKMEYAFSQIGQHRSIEKLFDELNNNQPFINNKIIKSLFMYMPILTFIFASTVLLFQLENLRPAAIIIIAIQVFIWSYWMRATHSYLKVLSHLPYKLNAYSQVISIIKSKPFDAEILKKIQAQLSNDEASAEQAIKELDKIANKVRIRHNILLWVLLNALLLWDIECAVAFEKWKKKYAPVAEEWFVALGNIESLLSFSILPLICNHTCLPVVSTAKKMSAQALGHPLISNKIRVNNDIFCEDAIFIISGSNMSGKTTFMRTVGINLVLARAGSYVCAKSMHFPLLHMMTSMRVADDLNEGISTFYAELKRIKNIITLAEKHPRMIFLIDEIFRGTNSIDRLSGAKAVLSTLDKLGAMGIITTHDLELCEIATSYPRIQNHSFSEEYRDNKIYFDYTIKPGKSTTTNAKYLMQMVGIRPTT